MESKRVAPYVHPISPGLNPYQALRCFESMMNPVLLESSAEAGGLGRFSIVAAEPFLIFESTGRCCKVFEGGQEHVLEADPLQELQRLLKRYHSSHKGPLPFYGGAIGFFSYDLKNQLEHLPQKAKRDVHCPEIWQGFYKWALIFDHQENTCNLVISEWEPNPEVRAELVLGILHQERLRVSTQRFHERRTPPSFVSNMTKDKYLESVERIRQYIRSGDVYQVNFTQRFHSDLEGTPMDLYGKVRSVNPAPFSAYVDTGAYQAVSASPERFLRLKGRTIETRPIKGTRPRGKDAAEDLANSTELVNSEKDQSELLMIVDLERNDLGRIAETGTVKVTELFKLETYATVFHLVATVTAEIREDLDIIDCLRATFPGGSITGAPKIRAMEIIDELEPTCRNLYTGAIGYIDFNGDSDLNIVIRTILCQGQDAWFHVGGGIVWDSDPQLEYEESLHKAKAQMRALSI